MIDWKMRGALLFAVLPLMAGLVAGSTARGMNVTIADNLTYGNARYFADTVGLSLAFSPRFSADLGGGLANRAPTTTDYVQSMEAGLLVEVAPRLAVTGGISRYEGERGMAADLSRAETTGTIPGRQAVDTVYAGIKARVFETSQDDPDERTSATFALSWAGGRHILPLSVAASPGWADRTPVAGEDRIKDGAYSAGVSLGTPGTTMAVSYIRHHYSSRFESPDPRWSPDSRPDFGFILGRLRTSVSGVLAGLPDYETTVTFSDRMPAGFSAYASYSYTRMETGNSIARTYVSEASWMASSWIELKAGSFWVRQYGRTTRYTTAGVSLHF